MSWLTDPSDPPPHADPLGANRCWTHLCRLAMDGTCPECEEAEADERHGYGFSACPCGSELVEVGDDETPMRACPEGCSGLSP